MKKAFFGFLLVIGIGLSWMIGGQFYQNTQSQSFSSSDSENQGYQVTIYLSENLSKDSEQSAKATGKFEFAEQDEQKNQAAAEALTAYVRSIGSVLELQNPEKVLLRVKNVRTVGEEKDRHTYVLLEQYVTSRAGGENKEVRIDQATLAARIDGEGRLLSLNSGLLDPPELKDVFSTGKIGIDMSQISEPEMNLLIESIRAAYLSDNEESRKTVTHFDQLIRYVNNKKDNEAPGNLSQAELLTFAADLIREEYHYSIKHSAPEAKKELEKLNIEEDIELQLGLLKLELKPLEGQELSVANLMKLYKEPSAGVYDKYLKAKKEQTSEAAPGFRNTVIDVAIRYLFSKIKPVGIQRMALITNASEGGEVSLSRYSFMDNLPAGEKAKDLDAGEVMAVRRHVWMYTIKGLYGLPVIFDLYVPQDPYAEKVLRMKNLRRLGTTASVNVRNSPLYPSGPHAPVDSDDQTHRIFSRAFDYFYSRYGWNSYNRLGATINVYKGMTSDKWKQNAYWSQYQDMFGIGAGGSWLYDLDRSADILGHEYSHAIVSYSSGLVYRGQSGGLNEHFADISGVAFEAAKFKGSIDSFDHIIGETSTYGGTGLRNLKNPWASNSTSFSHMDDVLASYGRNCQPSEKNDQCGVHSTSGVPNKAVSLLISHAQNHPSDQVGDIVDLVFNTVTNRLSSFSDFDDYLRQLVAECQSLGRLSDCNLIKEKFWEVGLKYPGYAGPGSDGPGEDNGTSEAWCGNIIETTGGNVTVEQYSEEGRLSPGDKVTGARFILASANYMSIGLNSVGYYGQLIGKSGQRYCVKGKTSLMWNKNGIGFQAFRVISDIYPEGGSIPQPDIPQEEDWTTQGVEAKYCGIINAPSGAANVNLIDNNFDTFILTSEYYQQVQHAHGSGYHTRGWSKYSEIFKADGAYHQKCGCATGIVHQIPNSKGRYFNAFKRVSAFELIPQSRCRGLVFR